MKRRGRPPGPRNTLSDLPHMAEIKQRLAAAGHTSLRSAAKSVGFSENGFLRVLREGLSGESKQSTIERLTKLGILDLVPRRQSA